MSIFDTVLTVLANGCYRWLAHQLHGIDLSKPKAVYRKFVETSGAVEIAPGNRLVVYLDRRSHNPILKERISQKITLKSPGWRTLSWNSFFHNSNKTGID